MDEKSVLTGWKTFKQLTLTMFGYSIKVKDGFVYDIPIHYRFFDPLI